MHRSQRLAFGSVLIAVFAAALLVAEYQKNSTRSADISTPSATTSDESIAAACGPLPSPGERARCVSPHLRALAAAASSSAAVATARALRDAGVVGECHFLAHDIGRFAFERERDIAKTLADCPGDCVWGCAHGAAAAFLRAHGGTTEDEQGRMLASACDGVGEKLTSIQCIHGLGHGLYDLLAGDTKRALEHCAALPPSDFHEDESCADGVLMEHVHAALVRGGARSVEDVCALLSAPVLRAHCIRALGQGLLIFLEYDAGAAEAACRMLAAPNERESCIASVRWEVSRERLR